MGVVSSHNIDSASFSTLIFSLPCCLRVKLEGQESTNLHVKGNVVEGTLQLLSHTTEEPLDCIGFGSTFYGTDCTESALLFNNGPEPVCFVAVLDEDAIGQEVVIDSYIIESCKCFKNNCVKILPSYNVTVTSQYFCS